MCPTPLSVLDLVPVASGSTPAEAIRRSVDLAERAERLGYRRYWLAEHHLNPGVAGTSPAIILALVAAATSTIRVGSGAVQMGHRTALSVVEEFGLLDAVSPGRLDLGLGRSGGQPRHAEPALVGVGTCSGRREDNGLRIPARFNPEALLRSPRFALQKRLLTLPDARPQDYPEQVDDILALLAGTYRDGDGTEAHVVPGEGADLQVWVLGSSGGESARVAGDRGLRFAANYHVSPGTVLEAVDAYRSAFRPSSEVTRPYVSVSADVVVAGTDRDARELAAGYGAWVHSIRSGAGAIPYPTPAEAAAHPLDRAAQELVVDRTSTRFVGGPGRVADQLEVLRDATDADELIVTTITHDHDARIRSMELLADAWASRGGPC